MAYLLICIFCITGTWGLETRKLFWLLQPPQITIHTDRSKPDVARWASSLAE
ncbi:MAG: hypothetical protein JNJ94_02360 [Chlorobi bacterium]|jgi:hypothetical protein|nr:hypothetical protein [Chlorobiota bacterium]